MSKKVQKVQEVVNSVVEETVVTKENIVTEENKVEIKNLVTFKNIVFSLDELKLQNLNSENKEFISVSSKSELFRKMYDAGIEICEISKLTNSHYSFVYGVISNSREVRNVVTNSKSDEFRKLFSEGKTPGEVAKLTNSNYSFVFGVYKKFKESNKTEQTVVNK
jgi:DNA invertase Pin-like site-specific DNA recombinase